MGKRLYNDGGTYRVVSKAANGEGSVYQRADGKWCASVVAIDRSTGKRRRVVLYGRTQAEAKRKRKAALDRVEAHAPVRDTKMTVSEWAQVWGGPTGSLEASERSESTKYLYRNLSRLHIEPAPFGMIGLDQLYPADIEAFFGITLRDRGLSESSRRTVYSILRMMLDGAKRDGKIATNPMLEIDRPSAKHKEKDYLTASEAKRLLKASEASWNHSLLRFLLGTGVRSGEATATKWSDIDLERGLYSVPGTKTASSKATIALSPALVAMLEIHKGVIEDYAEQHRGDVIVINGVERPRWTDSDLVFPSPDGLPVDGRSLRHMISKTAKDVGITKHVNVHTMRSTLR